MRIPNNNQWSQLNSGDIFGTLKKSIGISLDERGVVQLPGRPVSYYTENQDANFNIPVAIVYFNDEYNVVTADGHFKGDFDGTAINQEGGGPASADRGTDAIAVFGRMYVSSTTKLEYYNGTTYTDAGSITYSSVDYRPLAEFESLADDKLAVARDNVVELYDSSHNKASNELTLPQNLKITTMRYRNGYLYVGCRNVEGGEARVYIWDGSGNAAQYAIPTHSSWVFSMTEHGQSIAFVTERGEMRLITGVSSKVIARFPIYHVPGKRWTEDSDTYGKILNRGMISDGDKIFLSVYGNTVNDLVEGMYSGLWTFDPDSGLTHRAGVTSDRVDLDATPDSISDDTITMDANHPAETGDPVFVLNAGSVTGISAGTLYRTIKVSDTEFKFARNLYDAENGVPVQLGGSLGALSVRFLEKDTIGDIYGSEGGAVALINAVESPEDMWSHGGVMYGGRTDVGIDTICFLAPGQGVGSVTSQKIFSDQITSTFQKIYPFIRRLSLAVEQVLVKIKVEDKLGLPLQPQSVTWSDTDTFTTGNLEEWGAVSPGDEITVLSGYAAGRTAHVSSISAGASEYTVNLDETIGKAAETSTVEADNFKKLHSITSGLPNTTHPEVTVTEKLPWLQFKIELRGFNVALYFVEMFTSGDKQK